jgi:FtsP/CotA-like multicopper oxidase with cupredoxin domain
MRDQKRPTSIPTLLKGTTDSSGTDVYQLSMQSGTTQLVGSGGSATNGFNQGFHGPVIKVAKGDKVPLVPPA